MIPIRAVHLDLKGLPPTPKRLMQLPHVFAAAGFNAILVEWEDAFPWTVDRRFRSPTAYDSTVVREFHERSAQAGLDVIPLVQCLGHMETFLSLDSYRHLREVPDRSDVLRPLAPGGRELVERLIDDVLCLTPSPRFFHLGGDEAFTLGNHPLTRKTIEKRGLERIYLDHVFPLLEKLNQLGIRPILWHDMMSDWDNAFLRELGNEADVAVWGYNVPPQETTHNYSLDIIHRFATNGLRLWGATAYKGADGRTGDIPILERRIHNALGWCRVAREFGFHGVIATAWSRYATHHPQVDPLESSLDSLFSIGYILQHGCWSVKERGRCLAKLQAIGEEDRFSKCVSAIKDLAEVRQDAWTVFQQLHEQFALERRDERFSQSGKARELHEQLLRLIAQLESCAPAIRRAFTGLVDEKWLEEYLVGRIDSLRQAEKLTQSMMSVQPPRHLDIEQPKLPAIKNEQLCNS